MALLVCTGCTSRYSVGAAQCPQCGSTEYVKEGAEGMAKITVHGGATNAAADEVVVEDSEEVAEQPAEAEPPKSAKQDARPAKRARSARVTEPGAE